MFETCGKKKKGRESRKRWLKGTQFISFCLVLQGNQNENKKENNCNLVLEYL